MKINFCTVISLLGALLLLGGCVNQGIKAQIPQTPEAFIAAMQEGTTVVNSTQPYPKVLKTLEAKCDECLNKTFRYYDNKSGAPAGSITYRTTFEPLARDAARMTLRMIYNGGDAYAPEGGYYMLMADVQKQPNGKARTVLYGAREGHYESITVAVNDWLQGKTKGCPKLPHPN